MVELQAKLFRQGNSYALRVPTAFVSKGTLREGETYHLTVEKKDKEE